ncbi:MAG: hypothetical protein PR2021_0100 [Candidatus Phytoplasma pruni]|uniref:AAA domain-containing protein n=1 Tax=Poinsettia branch-inducing phytoplasma TaxID=138647 RepID=UPI00035C5DCF|nr:AAA domain-containing protein [Poinsettia branch-inducing phytoplasma]WEK82084.1 MAG: hypothetical protein PR2021_0100 [Candidatus Phytoplasma pruni]
MNIKYKRLLSLLDFTKETKKIRDKIIIDVENHEWYYHENTLLALPGVYMNPKAKKGDVWITIERFAPPVAPQITKNPLLKLWLNISDDYRILPVLKNKVKKSKLKESGFPITTNFNEENVKDFVFLKEFLPLNQSLQTDFDNYYQNTWKIWAEKEADISKTRQLYKKLYKLEQEFRSNQDDSHRELVLGVGIVLWNSDGKKSKIRYPLISHALEIHMNERTNSMELMPLREPQLELDIYTFIQNPGVSAIETAWKNSSLVSQEGKNVVFSPYNTKTFDYILKIAASHLDPQGEYQPQGNNDRTLLPITEKLKITDNWVVFIRPRDNKFLIQDLERFQSQFQVATRNLPDIPKGILSILEEQSDSRKKIKMPEFRSLEIHYSFNEDPEVVPVKDLFFTMASNEEQVKIIQKLEIYEGLVVQGPPGTGKTHTIANILSHYLTLGKRVLVTSMKKNALNVLRDKLLPEIRPLAVSFLSSEQEDLKQLEHNVSVIKDQINSIDEDKFEKDISSLEKEIDFIQNELAHIEQKIKEFFQRNFDLIVFLPEQSRPPIKPLDASKTLVKKRHKIEWFKDKLKLTNAPLFQSEDIAELKKTRLKVGKKISYLNIEIPAIEPDLVENLMEIHTNIITYDSIKKEIKENKIFSLEFKNDKILEKAQHLLKMLEYQIKLNQSLIDGEKKFTWHDSIKNTLKKSRHDLPLKEFAVFYKDIQETVAQQQDFLTRPVASFANLELDSEIMKAINKKASGKSAFGLFSFGKKAEKKKLSSIVIISNRPENKEDWKHVQKYFCLRKKMRNLIIIWQNGLASNLLLSDELVNYDNSDPSTFNPKHILHLKKVSDHYQYLIEKDIRDAEIIKLVSELLPKFPEIKQIPNRLDLLTQLQNDLQKNIEFHNVRDAFKQKNKIKNVFSISSAELFENVQNLIEEKCGNPEINVKSLKKETDSFLKEIKNLDTLKENFETIKKVSELIEKSGAPLWADDLRNKPPLNSSSDNLLPNDWDEIWWLKQLEVHLDNLQTRDYLNKMEAKRKQKIIDLEKVYKQIVSKKTWLQVSRKSTPDMESALQSFITHIAKIGKGTGKKAPIHRRQARQALTNILESNAIPCWIMPHDKISEVLPSQIGNFDLVIIDEASQSDLSALAAFLRADKILIVGDDKQVGPHDISDVSKTQILSQRFLKNQVKRYQGHLSSGSSIYELFQVVFAHEKIMLKEHFRSVSPIIEYSNREFYHNEIQPMRLPKKSERLDPPLIDVLVTDGACEDEKQEINKAEARYIVDEIKRICADPRMKDKTIGVVTLKGDCQEHYIYDMLERELPNDLLERHAIKCGNARTFQGEERNIIFLSLVVSFRPNGKKPMPLTKEDAYQRFNVAASRARDRMYLVRSIEMNENQLSNKDVLRRGIIKHFSLPFSQEEKKNKNLRTLCETDFERQIYDILVDLGYRVLPQVKVGSYRIDLVVEGDNDNRLAIDCHGDRLQSAEQDDHDLNRQRVLERNGWEFWNAFAFNFVLNKEDVIKDLIKNLEAKDIEPAKTENINQAIYTEQRRVTVFRKNEYSFVD